MKKHALPLLVACLSLFWACAGLSRWLTVQRELRELQAVARQALSLASDPRTVRLLELCASSAMRGVQRADEHLQADEKLRRARQQGVVIPELEQASRVALQAAKDAEKQARHDCSVAGVSGRDRASAAEDAGDGIVLSGDGAAPPLDAAYDSARPDLGSPGDAHPPEMGSPRDMGTDQR